MAAYDFSAPPANGGTWKWGSLSASPKVTVLAKNDTNYSSIRMIDTAVAPPGSTASLRWDVPDYASSGFGERADEWRISIDNYADQFDGDSPDPNKREFWVQWRTRMNDVYAGFGFSDRSGGDVPGSTTYKHLLCGEGMQTTMPTVNPAYPHGYEGPGTSQEFNHIAYTHSDFEGETNIVGTFSSNSSYPANWGFKYPSGYHGKPGYLSFVTFGQNGNYFTHHNSGIEGPHTPAACEYQLGAGYTDNRSCFIYPTDQWFTMMVHVILGPRGHGLSSLAGSYRNVAAARVAANQVVLVGDTYVEHFNPAVSAGQYVVVKGATTGSVTARVTAKTAPPPVTFTAPVAGLTSGTLTAPFVAGNGSYDWNFYSGASRTVTVSGASSTAVSWSGALPTDLPTTTAVTGGGTTLTFIAPVDGTTTGTLAAAIANGNYDFYFSNPQNEHRVVTVTGGKTVTWTGALHAYSLTQSAVPRQALLTLTDLSGPIQNETLQVDELENGFTNSTIEYYAALDGQALQLLHRRTGVVMRVGNYTDGLAYTSTARYGTFAWTTFMTNKSLTQRHGVGKVWVGQIIVKSGPVAPAPPA